MINASSPLRTKVVAAVGALALLVGAGVVAMPTPTPAPEDSGVQLMQQITLPQLTVGQAVTIALDPIITTIKTQAGYPNATVTLTSIDPLPAGLTWDKNTNTISGTPTTAGTTQVSVSGHGCMGFFCQTMTQAVPVPVAPASTTTPSTSAAVTTTSTNSTPNPPTPR